MAAAAVADAVFDRVLGDHFVEHGFLALATAEDTPEALDVLADGPRAGEDYRDIGFGDVDALVEYF